MHPRQGKENDPVIVTIIHYAYPLQLTEQIEDRAIPKRLSKNGKVVYGPKVLMEFEVKGIKFDSFPDLFATGSFCKSIDFAFDEIHPFKWDGGS